MPPSFFLFDFGGGEERKPGAGPGLKTMYSVSDQVQGRIAWEEEGRQEEEGEAAEAKEENECNRGE